MLYSLTKNQFYMKNFKLGKGFEPIEVVFTTMTVDLITNEDGTISLGEFQPQTRQTIYYEQETERSRRETE